MTCDLSPPHNFLRETHHKTRETALKAVAQAKRVFRSLPGLHIEVQAPRSDRTRKTAWARILAV